MRVRAVATVMALLVLTAGAAWGVGGSVTDQAVTLTYGATHWSAHPAATFVGTETTPGLSWLSEIGWWYRVDGDSHEYPLPVPDSETYVDGTIRAYWSNVDGMGFQLQEVTQIYDH